MDESVLWIVALGTGSLGLLLLTIAGAVAVYWNTATRGPSKTTSSDKSQSRAGDIAAADKKRSPTTSTETRPQNTGAFWLWTRAWLFAFFHASIVSVVLGGITFFEDLVKAGEEIQTTGTVTFPKQLLPGTLSGSTSRKHLLQSSGDSSRAEGDPGVGKLGSPGNASSGETGWEVVDRVNEVGAGDS